MISLTESASVFCGYFCASASCYCCAKDVRIVPIIVAEFEFSDVQRQVFAADLVKAAHDAAFQERPKAVDRLSVHDAINILPSGMAHKAMVIVFPEVGIAGVLIGSDQAHLFGDGLTNKNVKCLGIGAVNHASNDIALTADSADDCRFAG